MESYLLGNLHVLNNTLSDVGAESSGVNVQLETITINDRNLSWWESVQLSHAFDFSELDEVSILEFMSLVFMDSDNSRVTLSHIHHDEWSRIFTISVVDNEAVTVVQENETARSECLAEDEASSLASAEVVSLHNLVNVLEDLCHAHYLVISHIFGGEVVDLLNSNV